MRRFASAACALGAAFALGCGDELPPVEAAPASPPVPISVAQVAQAALVEPVIGTGTLAAEKTTDLGARVSGIVEQVHVRVGDQVAEGDRLFTLRRADHQIRALGAEYAARLSAAEAEKSRRDLARIQELHGRGVASDEQLDAARTSFEIASARRGAADSELAMARQNLADTVVRAPYAGAITRRYLDEGAMLSAQMNASPVIQIMKTDLVVAIVQIPELQLPRVSLGTPARVHVDGAAQSYDTSVAVLNARVDPATRAFEVRLPIRNEDLALRPGLFARAELLPPPRELLTLPRAALLGSESERFVFALAERRAARRAVRVRDLDALRVEVIEGLAAGDSVLIGPNLGALRDGSAVSVELARVDR